MGRPAPPEPLSSLTSHGSTKKKGKLFLGVVVFFSPSSAPLSARVSIFFQPTFSRSLLLPNILYRSPSRFPAISLPFLSRPAFPLPFFLSVPLFLPVSFSYSQSLLHLSPGVADSQRLESNIHGDSGSLIFKFD